MSLVPPERAEAWALGGEGDEREHEDESCACDFGYGSLVCGASGAAYATEGWYGRVDAGYSTDGNFEPGLFGWRWGDEVDVKNDWLQSVGLGYAFQDGVRLEGELAHRFNEIDAAPRIDAGGDAHIWSAMFNWYFDFNRGEEVEPYIGFGFGAARAVVNGANAAPPPLSTLDAQDTAPAIQGMAGIAFAVNQQLSLDIGYKFFATSHIEFTSHQPAPVKRRADYEQSSATIGLRWQFQPAAAPAPMLPPPLSPPPPPPLPPRMACPTQDFAIYFEWDRSNLNQAAIYVIQAAIARARGCDLSAVSVVGHTDTSGSAQYNIGLSERRASVVRDALASRGARAGLIVTQARGETDSRPSYPRRRARAAEPPRSRDDHVSLARVQQMCGAVLRPTALAAPRRRAPETPQMALFVKKRRGKEAPSALEGEEYSAVACFCRTDNCAGRWPISSLDAYNASTRPAICAEVSVAPFYHEYPGEVVGIWREVRPLIDWRTLLER